MKKKRTEHLGKKLLSVILALAVCVSFVPAFGAVAYAEEETPDSVLGNEVVDMQEIDGQGIDGQEVDEQDVNEDGNIEINLDGKDVEIPTDGTEVELDAEDLGLDAEGAIEEEPENIVNVDELAQDTSDGEEATEVEEVIADGQDESLGAGSSFSSLAKNCTYPKQAIKYTYNVKTDTVTLSGSVKAPWLILGIFVVEKGNINNLKKVKEYSGGTRSINYSFSMKEYPIGYHSVAIYVVNPNDSNQDTNQDILYRNYVPNNIYIKPSNRATFYEVYSKYIFYKGKNFYGSQNYEQCELFLDYKAPGGKWKGPTYIPGNNTAIGGFSPNKNYQFRTFYRLKTSYTPVNGKAKTYYFDGRATGCVSPVVTCKTGFGALPIKSVKVKAYKVKKRKHKYWSSYYYNGWYTGGWVKEKYYTYKLKITVKMKKKPGVQGVVINGKTIKGNKKKYTAKFGTYTSLKKPKKLKCNVTVYGYINGTYKGYSYMYSKKKKIK